MVGRVRVYEEEVAPDLRAKVLVFDELLKVMSPVLLDEVPKVRALLAVNAPEANTEAPAPVTFPAEDAVRLVNEMRLVAAVVPERIVSQPDPMEMAFDEVADFGAGQGFEAPGGVSPQEPVVAVLLGGDRVEGR